MEACSSKFRRRDQEWVGRIPDPPIFSGMWTHKAIMHISITCPTTGRRGILTPIDFETSPHPREIWLCNNSNVIIHRHEVSLFCAISHFYTRDVNATARPWCTKEKKGAVKSPTGPNLPQVILTYAPKGGAFEQYLWAVPIPRRVVGHDIRYW